MDGSSVKEAEVVRCRNGAAVNFTEDYMRRRDPDCMRIADDLPTDKPRFKDVYGYDFSELRADTLRWLARQELILVPRPADTSSDSIPFWSARATRRSSLLRWRSSRPLWT